jgi:hypothetical protein
MPGGFEGLGEAKLAGAGNAVGELGGDEVAVDGLGGGLGAEGGGQKGFLGIFEDLAEEDGLEGAGGGAELVGFGDVRVVGEAIEGEVEGVDAALEGVGLHG